MRKTIFEQLKENISFSSEINRLDTLMNDNLGIKIEMQPDAYGLMIGKKKEVKYYSLETFVDKFGFKNWLGRGTCINCADMRETLQLNETLDMEEPTEENIVSFVEYVANMLYISKHIELNERCTIINTPVVKAIEDNIQSVLDWMNLKASIFDDKEQVIITEKSAAVTAVSEIIEKNLAYQIVYYNHHTLKGNIEKKKSILLMIGNELEPKRKILSSINSQLETNIFFMLNNLNIRHNNRSKRDKNYKEYVAKMKKSKLEEWYDELYQMLLLAILELDQINRNDKISELKSKF